MSVTTSVMFSYFEEGKGIQFLPISESNPARDIVQDIYWHDLATTIQEKLIRNYDTNRKVKLDFLDSTKDHGGKATDENTVIVLFVEMRNFTEHTFFMELVKRFRPIMELENKLSGDIIEKEPRPRQEIKDFPFQPIITIGLEDITSLFTEDGNDENPNNKFLYDLQLDSRVKFFDSSIWHRYIPVLSLENNYNFLEEFMLVFEKMRQHIAKGLYATNVARTTLEFQTRMMLNSCISDIGNGGHAGLVTPFKFHSERQMAKKAKKVLSFFEKEYKQGNKQDKLKELLEWNMLLVDDQADSEISRRVGQKRITKKMVIEGLLEDIIVRKSTGRNSITIIPAATTEGQERAEDVIAGSMDKLGKKIYDVILLDYLLGLTIRKRRREYGFELLLKMETERKLKRGPIDRFWVFPISSFPYAFDDKLRQLGIDNLNEYWHLSNGGDPVSTPELFRYNLFRFMQQQVLSCYLHPDSLKLFFQKFEHIKNAKVWARAVLFGLDHFEARRNILDNDIKSNSALAESLKKYIAYENRNRLIEALKELIEPITSRQRSIQKKDGKKRLKEVWATYYQYIDGLELMREKLDKFLPESSSTQATKIFISSTARDKKIREKLSSFLAPLIRYREIVISSLDTIEAGEIVEERIEEEIQHSEIIICLISANYFAVQFDEIEMIEKLYSLDKSVRIIPINVSPSQVKKIPFFKKLQLLPRNGDPISSFNNPDREWNEIASEIDRFVTGKRNKN